MENDEGNKVSAEFAAALIKARMALKAPGKDGKNPHFKSQYMTLDNLTASVMDAMEGNGLMVLQQPFSLMDEGGLCVGVETVILHSSGQTLSSGRDFFCRVVGGDGQKVGAAVTYLRRYGLGAMLGVVVEEDDDGNAASNRGHSTVAQKMPLSQPKQQNQPPLAIAKPDAKANPQRPEGKRGMLFDIVQEIKTHGIDPREIKSRIAELCDGESDVRKLSEGDIDGLVIDFSQWLDAMTAEKEQKSNR